VRALCRKPSAGICSVSYSRSPDLWAKEKEIPGNDLLSRPVARAVPSAQTGLTAVFGMGTGVTPSLWSPDISLYKRKMKPAKCVTMTRLRMSHVAGAMRHRAALHDGGAQCECRVQSTEKWDGWSSPRPISTAQLKELPLLHLRPINQMVSLGSYPVTRWEILSWSGLRA
jgi:hypothetical protein